MINLKDIGKEIHFDQPTHTYTVNGQKLTSMTTVISNYKKKFDETGIIAQSCAKREGISVKEITQRWEDKKNSAASRGTKFHAEIENYINTGRIADGEFNSIITQFSKIKHDGKLFPEVRIFSKKYGIAGTTDLITLFDDKSIIVGDWKSNARFDIKARYGGKLLYPLEHIGESHLETYSLQLWGYSIMLEEFGYKIKDNPIIYWIDSQNDKIVSYRALDMKNDALKMMQHFKSIQEF